VSSQGIGYVAAVALGVVFAFSAVAKARDLAGTEQQFEGLGLPRAMFFSRFIPVVEFSIVALLLIVPATGAIAALVTLAFFTTFLIGRLKSGIRVPCACFGASKTTPLSALSIVRNVGLMALAAAALNTDRPVRVSLADIAFVLIFFVVVGGGIRLADSVNKR